MNKPNQNYKEQQGEYDQEPTRAQGQKDEDRKKQEREEQEATKANAQKEEDRKKQERENQASKGRQ